MEMQTQSGLVDTAGEGESGMGDGREAQKGEYICIIMADSHCCTAETNTTL